MKQTKIRIIILGAMILVKQALFALAPESQLRNVFSQERGEIVQELKGRTESGNILHEVCRVGCLRDFKSRCNYVRKSLKKSELQEQMREKNDRGQCPLDVALAQKNMEIIIYVWSQRNTKGCYLDKDEYEKWFEQNKQEILRATCERCTLEFSQKRPTEILEQARKKYEYRAYELSRSEIPEYVKILWLRYVLGANKEAWLPKDKESSKDGVSVTDHQGQEEVVKAKAETKTGLFFEWVREKKYQEVACCLEYDAKLLSFRDDQNKTIWHYIWDNQDIKMFIIALSHITQEEYAVEASLGFATREEKASLSIGLIIMQDREWCYLWYLEILKQVPEGTTERGEEIRRGIGLRLSYQEVSMEQMYQRIRNWRYFQLERYKKKGDNSPHVSQVREEITGSYEALKDRECGAITQRDHQELRERWCREGEEEISLEPEEILTLDIRWGDLITKGNQMTEEERIEKQRNYFDRQVRSQLEEKVREGIPSSFGEEQWAKIVQGQVWKELIYGRMRKRTEEAFKKEVEFKARMLGKKSNVYMDIHQKLVEKHQKDQIEIGKLLSSGLFDVSEAEWMIRKEVIVIIKRVTEEKIRKIINFSEQCQDFKRELGEQQQRLKWLASESRQEVKREIEKLQEYQECMEKDEEYSQLVKKVLKKYNEFELVLWKNNTEVELELQRLVKKTRDLGRALSLKEKFIVQEKRILEVDLALVHAKGEKKKAKAESVEEDRAIYNREATNKSRRLWEVRKAVLKQRLEAVKQSMELDISEVQKVFEACPVTTEAKMTEEKIVQKILEWRAREQEKYSHLQGRLVLEIWNQAISQLVQEQIVQKIKEEARKGAKLNLMVDWVKLNNVLQRVRQLSEGTELTKRGRRGGAGEEEVPSAKRNKKGDDETLKKPMGGWTKDQVVSQMDGAVAVKDLRTLARCLARIKREPSLGINMCQIEEWMRDNPRLFWLTLEPESFCESLNREEVKVIVRRAQIKNEEVAEWIKSVVKATKPNWFQVGDVDKRRYKSLASVVQPELEVPEDGMDLTMEQEKGKEKEKEEERPIAPIFQLVYQKNYQAIAYAVKESPLLLSYQDSQGWTIWDHILRADDIKMFRVLISFIRESKYAAETVLGLIVRTQRQGRTNSGLEELHTKLGWYHWFYLEVIKNHPSLGDASFVRLQEWTEGIEYQQSEKEEMESRIAQWLNKKLGYVKVESQEAKSKVDDLLKKALEGVKSTGATEGEVRGVQLQQEQSREEAGQIQKRIPERDLRLRVERMETKNGYRNWRPLESNYGAREFWRVAKENNLLHLLAEMNSGLFILEYRRKWLNNSFRIEVNSDGEVPVDVLVRVGCLEQLVKWLDYERTGLQVEMRPSQIQAWMEDNPYLFWLTLESGSFYESFNKATVREIISNAQNDFESEIKLKWMRDIVQANEAIWLQEGAVDKRRYRPLASVVQPKLVSPEGTVDLTVERVKEKGIEQEGEQSTVQIFQLVYRKNYQAVAYAVASAPELLSAKDSHGWTIWNHVLKVGDTKMFMVLISFISEDRYAIATTLGFMAKPQGQDRSVVEEILMKLEWCYLLYLEIVKKNAELINLHPRVHVGLELEYLEIPKRKMGQRIGKWVVQMLESTYIQECVDTQEKEKFKDILLEGLRVFDQEEAVSKERHIQLQRELYGDKLNPTLLLSKQEQDFLEACDNLEKSDQEGWAEVPKKLEEELKGQLAKRLREENHSSWQLFVEEIVWKHHMREVSQTRFKSRQEIVYFVMNMEADLMRRDRIYIKIINRCKEAYSKRKNIISVVLQRLDVRADAGADVSVVVERGLRWSMIDVITEYIERKKKCQEKKEKLKTFSSQLEDYQSHRGEARVLQNREEYTMCQENLTTYTIAIKHYEESLRLLEKELWEGSEWYKTKCDELESQLDGLSNQIKEMLKVLSQELTASRENQSQKELGSEPELEKEGEDKLMEVEVPVAEPTGAEVFVSEPMEEGIQGVELPIGQIEGCQQEELMEEGIENPVVPQDKEVQVRQPEEQPQIPMEQQQGGVSKRLLEEDLVIKEHHKGQPSHRPELGREKQRGITRVK